MGEKLKVWEKSLRGWRRCPRGACGGELYFVSAATAGGGFAKKFNKNKMVEDWQCLVCGRMVRRSYRWRKMGVKVELRNG